MKIVMLQSIINNGLSDRYIVIGYTTDFKRFMIEFFAKNAHINCVYIKDGRALAYNSNSENRLVFSAAPILEGNINYLMGFSDGSKYRMTDKRLTLIDVVTSIYNILKIYLNGISK